MFWRVTIMWQHGIDIFIGFILKRQSDIILWIAYCLNLLDLWPISWMLCTTWTSVVIYPCYISFVFHLDFMFHVLCIALLFVLGQHKVIMLKPIGSWHDSRYIAYDCHYTSAIYEQCVWWNSSGMSCESLCLPSGDIQEKDLEKWLIKASFGVHVNPYPFNWWLVFF